MIGKKLSREIAMQLLFQWEAQGIILKKNDIEPIYLPNYENTLSQFLDNFYTKDQSKLDIKQILIWVTGIIKNITYIDQLIDSTSTKWRIARLDAIDRAILRLAIYELKLEKKLSHKIIINEAIELAKRYGGEQSFGFVNGLLDAIKNNPS